MKNKIRLDTMQDAIKFSAIAQSLGDNVKITITDREGLRVNAKSILGMIYALEFSNLWCESNIDVYNKISEFIIV